eukprot:m.27447 g.27447  ORF g.27447 m.27447 type:complete len:342 (-) comp13422_c0_seq3:179-1204(-)
MSSNSSMSPPRQASSNICVTTATFLLLILHNAVGQGNAIAGESFGVAHKSCLTNPDGKCIPWVMDRETVVFEHTVKEGTLQTGNMMRHFWCGGNWPGYENSRLRYYVDDEPTASVDFPFGLGHGSNMMDDDAPWSAGSAFGKTGQPSGIFNTYIVPFTRTIKVTVELRSFLETDQHASTDASPSQSADVKFWIILRGHSTLGNTFTLPGAGAAIPQRARLHTAENHEVSVLPGEQLTVFNSSAKYGALFLVTLAVNSSGGETFLEGCFRAWTPQGELKYVMSSGTEDYFLGTYYFNKGAACTHAHNVQHTNFVSLVPTRFLVLCSRRIVGAEEFCVLILVC